MLVVTRKHRQSIMIGDDIEIFVLSIRADRVRIGVDAPRPIRVFRKEVYQAIHQNSGAARAEVDDASKRLSASDRAAR